MIFLCLLFGEIFSYPDLEIYEYPTSDMIAMQNGSVFILNSMKFHVLKVDVDGTMTKIGERGMGPGEFQTPISLQILGDDLFVFEFGKPSFVHQFKVDGTFVQKIQGTPNYYSLKVPGGFLATTGDMRPTKGPQDPGSLVFFGANVEKTLLKLGSGPHTKESPSFGPRINYFNPCRTDPLFVRDVSLPFAAVAWGENRDRVSLVDLMQKKVLFTHTFKMDLMPFDETWADKIYEIRKRSPMVRNGKEKLVKAYPDHFPLIQSLHLLGDGKVHIAFWGTQVTRPSAIIDIDGNKEECIFSSKDLMYLVAIIDSDAILQDYSRDGEFKLFRVEKAEAKSLIKSWSSK